MTDVKKTQATKTINNKTYLINAFKGIEGWGYLPRLTKYVFPFVGMLYKGDEASDEDMIAAIQEAMAGDSAKEVTQLIVDLLSGVQVNNMAINFDTEFAQNYDALVLLVVEVIKLNYFDSFQRLVTSSQEV